MANVVKIYILKGADVALKKLKSPEQMDQFMQEAEFLQKLTHPHIVLVWCKFLYITL